MPEENDSSTDLRLAIGLLQGIDMKTGVFFERDGVLNRSQIVQGHEVPPTRLEDFEVNSTALPLLQELRGAGFILIVTTHQPGISRGELRRTEVDLMHSVLRRKLPIHDVYLCGADDSSHPCQKPNPGMFLEAAFKWGLDLDRSFVISNKWPDAKAAQIAGCTSIMIRSPWIGADHHDFVVESLDAAVRKIQQLGVRPVYANC